MGEKLEFTGWWIFFLALGIATFIAVGYFWLGWGKKVALDLDRQAIKYSQPYVESVQSELASLKREFDKVGTQIAQYEAENSTGKYNSVLDNLRVQQGSIRAQYNDRLEKLPPELRRSAGIN